MFDNIIGHEDKKTYFKNIIKEHNISHSYILYGNEGIGKLTFAKELAKQILSVDNLEICPDYKYIEKLEDKKDIVIEQIRKEIIEDVYIAPIASEHKLYIINDAECLNTAAQNSLLKTLEEPPKYIIIIMICSNINKILHTIKSRANKINFIGVESQEIRKYINEKFDINLAPNIVGYLDGSIGNAIHIIKDGLIDTFKKIDILVEYIIKKDILNSLNLCADIDFSKLNIIAYLEYVMYTNKIYSAIKIIEKAKLRLKNNGNYDIVIDNMILKIIDEI